LNSVRIVTRTASWLGGDSGTPSPRFFFWGEAVTTACGEEGYEEEGEEKLEDEEEGVGEEGAGGLCLLKSL